MANEETIFEIGSLQAPIYLLADVGRYVRLHPSKASRWVRYIPGRPIDLPPSRGLSFLDLISMLVMSALRAYGVRLSSIRIAEEYLASEFGLYPYPLARKRIWTDGRHVLFAPKSPLRAELPSDSPLISADEWGQWALTDVLLPYLHRVDYGQEEIAIAWSPIDGVRLDPSIQFGQPCVDTTRIPTHSLYSLYKAGDTPDRIAFLYRIARDDVTSAITWESRLEQAVA